MLLLNNKYGVKSEQVLFDFKNVLKAVIEICAKNQEAYVEILLSAFGQFLALYKTEPRKFQARTEDEMKYLSQVWDIFANFFISYSNILPTTPDIIQALSLLSLKSKCRIYFNKDVIKFYQENIEAVKYFIELTFDENSEVEK